MTLIETSQKLAHDAHDSIGQKRKYTGEPYWQHTDAVAALVASVEGTPEMIAAAHLHDYLEDVLPQLLSEERYLEVIQFQDRYNVLPIAIRNMVKELTDEYVKELYPNLNRAQRKEKERARLATISDDGKSIKLADLINNTSDIVANDPEFAKTYLKEKLALLPYLSEGNAALLQQASVQVIAGCIALGIPIPTLGA